eukprot:UN33903
MTEMDTMINQIPKTVNRVLTTKMDELGSSRDRDMASRSPGEFKEIQEALRSILSHEKMILSHLNINSLFYNLIRKMQSNVEKKFEFIRDACYQDNLTSTANNQQIQLIIENVENKLIEQIVSTIKDLQDTIGGSKHRNERVNTRQAYSKLHSFIGDEFNKLSGSSVPSIRQYERDIKNIVRRIFQDIQNVGDDQYLNGES